MITLHDKYNPKSEKVRTVWKMQIKRKVVISKFTPTCTSLQTAQQTLFNVFLMI